MSSSPAVSSAASAPRAPLADTAAALAAGNWRLALSRLRGAPARLGQAALPGVDVSGAPGTAAAFGSLLALLVAAVDAGVQEDPGGAAWPLANSGSDADQRHFVRLLGTYPDLGLDPVQRTLWLRQALAGRPDLAPARSAALMATESSPEVRAALLASWPASPATLDAWVDTFEALGESPWVTTVALPGLPGPVPPWGAFHALCRRADLSDDLLARVWELTHGHRRPVLMERPDWPALALRLLCAPEDGPSGLRVALGSAHERGLLLDDALSPGPTAPALARDAQRRALLRWAPEVEDDVLEHWLSAQPAGPLGFSDAQLAELLARLPRAGRLLLLRHLGRRPRAPARGTDPSGPEAPPPRPDARRARA